MDEHLLFPSSIADFPNLGEQRTHKYHHHHRSHSAPSLVTDIKNHLPSSEEIGHDRRRKSSNIVKQAIVGLVLYISLGTIFYINKHKSFHLQPTIPLVDALYFSMATLCTIGYGDIVPATTLTKLFTCAYILLGFGFVDILLHSLVTYVLDKQETLLLTAVDDVHTLRTTTSITSYVMDMEKGRVRVRIKVGLAVAVAVGCIAVGTLVARAMEGLSWVDSFYMSVTSVTTVGYGDYGFRTAKGRLFATVWLLVSTVAVAKAFLYLTEYRMEKRNRRVATCVLKKKLTVGDLVAADLDKNGSISEIRQENRLSPHRG